METGFRNVQILSNHNCLAVIEFSKFDKQTGQLLIGANVPKIFRSEYLRSAPNPSITRHC